MEYAVAEENQTKFASEKTSNTPVKFARDVIWVGIYLLFTSLFGIITLPILTKSINSTIYGVWAQIIVTVSLLTPILVLYFNTAAVRFLAGEQDKEKRRRYFGAMLFVILIFSSSVFIIANLFAPMLSTFLFASPEYVNFARLTFLWTFIDALFFFAISYLRARGQIKRLSLIQILFLTFKIILVVTLPLLGLGLAWTIAFIIIVEIFFTACVYYLIIRDIGFPRPNTAGLSTFLAFSAPQIPSGILLWIINASDRYFITHFLGLSQTGIYSSSFLLASVIILFYAPIGYVLLPTLSIAWEKNKMDEVRNYLEYSTRLFLTLAIPATVGITLMSQPLLNLLTTSEFLAGSQLVLLIAIGTMFLGIFEMNVYIIYLVKKTKWMPLMILAASIISVGMNLVLIPRIGINGAAISNVTAYFVLASIVTIWARKALNYTIDLLYLGKVAASSLIIGVCIFFIDVNGIVEIALAVLLAVIIMISMLFLLKAFSQDDRSLIKKILGGFIPWLN
jgi:O-antigen/teichoic acid export membrane protein